MWKLGLVSSWRRKKRRVIRIMAPAFDSGLGFVAFIDTLPETLTFAVKEKEERQQSG